MDSCLFVSDLKPSDCASWVQAWGTVFAILASGALVFVQHRLQRQRDGASRHAEIVKRMRIVQEIAEGTAANMNALTEHFPARRDVHDVAEGRTPFPQDVLDRVAEAVEAIPLHELDSQALVFNVRVLVMGSRLLRSRLQWMLANHRKLSAGDFSDGFKDFRKLTDQCQAAFERIRRHADEAERAGVVPTQFETGSDGTK